MDTPIDDPKTIDEYIDACPEDVRRNLRALRQAIREEAPEAGETIAYRMPTFTLHGNLVHFAAFKDHISLFPTSSPMNVFRDRLSAYRTSKGTIQFPMDRPLPMELIREIVRFRVDENIRRSEAKSGKRKRARIDTIS